MAFSVRMRGIVMLHAIWCLENQAAVFRLMPSTECLALRANSTTAVLGSLSQKGLLVLMEY